VCSKNGLGGQRLFGCVADILDCASCDNGGDGFMLDTIGGSISGCTASRNTGAGVRLMNGSRCSVCDCASHGNSGEGIAADAACTGLAITECDCQQNSVGFSISNPSNLLLWNTASRNGANYSLDPSMAVVVITPTDMLGNPNPHANYSA
jgi:parallel beta-helix repeat protein